jgi:hypothetical protein
MNIRILSQEIVDLDVSGNTTVRVQLELRDEKKEALSQKAFMVQHGDTWCEYVTDRCGQASLKFVTKIFEDTRKEIILLVNNERIVHPLHLPQPQHYQKTTNNHPTPKQKLSPEEALEKILRSVVSS